MNLLIQFQIILASFFFGIFFMIFYDFLNRLLYFKKGTLLRLILEIIFFSTMTLFFFLVMLKIANAKLNIFIPLFILLGIVVYVLTMQPYFQKVYQFIFYKFGTKIKQKRLYFSAKFDIIKMKRRKARLKRHEKNRKSKKSNISQKQS